MRISCSLVIVSMLLASSSAFADDASQKLRQRISELEAEVRKLKDEVARLQKPSAPATAAPEETGPASPFAGVIEAGLTKSFGVTWLPVGRFQVVSAMTAQMEGGHLKGKRLTPKQLESLNTLAKFGFLTIREHKSGNLESLMRAGTRTFESVVSEKARESADKALSNDDWVVVPLWSHHVVRVVRDVEYKSAGADELRLVIGTHKQTPTPLGKELGGKERERKFRVLLKRNPIDDTYSFVGADWGKLDSDGWETKNIP